LAVGPLDDEACHREGAVTRIGQIEDVDAVVVDQDLAGTRAVEIEMGHECLRLDGGTLARLVIAFLWRGSPSRVSVRTITVAGACGAGHCRVRRSGAWFSERGVRAMSRRLLCLFALLFVADAIVVNGRPPRPVTRSGKEVIEAIQFTRLQAPAFA
jgi:hypothetical protein